MLNMLLGCLLAWFFTPAAMALGIEEAVSLALANNELARAAGQDALAATARVGRYRSPLLPSLAGSGQWTRHGQDITAGDGLVGRLTLSQTLLSARSYPLLSQAVRGREAARFQQQQTERDLAYATSAAFLDALTAERVAQAAEQRRALAAQALEEIRLRFDAQLTGSNDVTRAELEAATAEREWVRGSGDARVARLRLGNLLGGPLTDSLDHPDALLETAGQGPGTLSGVDPATQRADLQAARARVSGLRQAALEPLLRWVPDLDASLSTLAHTGDGLDGPRHNWTLALGLNWQLFDGGAREADRAENLALARAAEQRLAGFERGLALEQESARVLLDSARSALERSEVALDAARRNGRESAELYRRGLIRALDVVDANVQLYEAEAERVRAQSGLASAYLALRQALGLDPFGKEIP